MPLILADRVRETTTTTGQGTVTLDGAVTGFQTFAAIGNGNTTYYTIAGQGTSEWEVGVGTYTSSGTTLSRDTVLASSAGAPTKTTFSAGTKDVFVTYPAGRSVYSDGTNVTPDRFNSLGVGTAASGTAGEIRATNNVTAYFSDDRLKDKLGKIENALDKLCSLEGFYYEPNKIAQSLGYEVIREVGISAQQMKEVLPEIVAPAPVDAQYMTVRYERALPLIVEAIKELRAEVAALKKGG
jgi:hypothetical protein